MERAGAALDDRELSEAMKERGLGTPATRAETIETLLRRGYAERQGKALAATDTGIRLVDLVPSPVKSAALTGEWEAQLARMRRKEVGLPEFMQRIEAFVRELVGQTLGAPGRASLGAPGERSARGICRSAAARRGPAPAPVPPALRDGRVAAPLAEPLPEGRCPSRLPPSPVPAAAPRPATSPPSCASGSACPPSGRTRRRCAARCWTARTCCSSCRPAPGSRSATSSPASPAAARRSSSLPSSRSWRTRSRSSRRWACGRSASTPAATAAASRAVGEAYLEGRLDFLFIAPERLRVPGFPEMLARRTPALVAVDEAHCISEWGHDFRPDYRLLGERLPALRPAPIVALTATATPRVQRDIAEQLALAAPRRFIHGFRRTNIAIEAATVKPGEDRTDIALRVLREPERRPAIVYAPTRKGAEELATALAADGRTAAAYHAGMAAPRRERVQTAFLGGELDVVVATIAFGMGIDKPDVRTVLHTAMPSTVEGYYQEIGRAGRDGKASRAVLLYSWADRRTHEYFLERDYPEPEVLERLFRALPAEPRPIAELRPARPPGPRGGGERSRQALDPRRGGGGGGHGPGGARGLAAHLRAPARAQEGAARRGAALRRVARLPDAPPPAPLRRRGGPHAALRRLRRLRPRGDRGAAVAPADAAGSSRASPGARRRCGSATGRPRGSSTAR